LHDGGRHPNRHVTDRMGVENTHDKREKFGGGHRCPLLIAFAEPLTYYHKKKRKQNKTVAGFGLSVA
jgi:hypothetical protein